jgi:hypothetical protein
MVFAILWVSQLFDEMLDGVGRRPDETQTPKMSHLFAVNVVQATVKATSISLSVHERYWKALLNQVDLQAKQS